MTRATRCARPRTVGVASVDEVCCQAAAPQVTRVIKEDLNPSWNQTLTLYGERGGCGCGFFALTAQPHSLLESEPKETFTLTLRCWDKHMLRKDKFLGQFTVTFNSNLVSSTEAIEHWFPLTSRKPQEKVTGSVHLKIQYGDLKASATGLNNTSVAAKLGLNT